MLTVNNFKFSDHRDAENLFEKHTVKPGRGKLNMPAFMNVDASEPAAKFQNLVFSELCNWIVKLII